MSLAPEAFRTIDAHTLRHRLNNGDELALLDVREAGQFGEGHPFFAIPQPFSRLELDAPRLLPRKSVRIALVDDGIADTSVAQRAATRLQRLSIATSRFSRAGVRGWREAGYTLFLGVNVPSKTFGELVEHAYGTPHVSVQQLRRWQAERSGCPLALIDGRTRAEHRKMTIPGAVCVPNAELAAHVDAFAGATDTTIVVHCAGRTRSIIGAQTLHNLGIRRDVFTLENGTQGWALAGFTLEHGSTRSPADAWPSDVERKEARARAQALAQCFGVSTLDDATARTLYLLDVRTPEDYARDGRSIATHAPGGQLVQANDQSVAGRGARLLLIDYDGIRAPVVAHWLVQLSFETAFVDAADAARWPTPDRADVQPEEPAAAPPASHAVVLDLRPSAAHEIAQPAGSRWTIRSCVFETLRQADAHRDTPIVLFADAAAHAAARLVADNLREAGFAEVTTISGGLDA